MSNTTIEIPFFENEPLLDFSSSRGFIEGKILEELEKLRRGENKVHALISGQEQISQESFLRKNPSNNTEIVSRTFLSGKNEVDLAIEKIKTSTSAKEWSSITHLERARRLQGIATSLRKKRLFFIALMMFEVGKTMQEADAEVCEAIDFANWYCAYAPFLAELNKKTLINPPGEKNEGFYIPIGETPICVSIQPWNFPLAISTGPAIAALVTGHSVLYKPSKLSSLTGHYLAKTIYESSIPRDIFHFLPGNGSVIGRYAVEHPDVNIVTFTGSKGVRARIQKSVAHFNEETIHTLPPHKRYEKRALALESGGKNVIILDYDADLDDTILGVCDSAFGFQGQKCSACSRLIIIDPKGVNGRIYKKTLERLKERIKGYNVGSPENFKNKMGPMIDENAYHQMERYITWADENNLPITNGDVPKEESVGGHFVPPFIVENVPHDSILAHEEIFGPILSVFCVKDLDEAIELANSVEFGLTAGIYSRNPESIRQAKIRLKAGNIYVNKKITGATVGKQPFGGIKMSGNSSKAGGWDYLLQFMDRKNISENTMRHGIPIE